MKWKLFVFICLFIIAFVYRYPNLKTPFWVDEFSTARNALLIHREGWQVIKQQNEFFEHHNVTEHFLVALFFHLFGISEYSARLPSVIIGSSIPFFIFYVAKKLYDRNTAIVATLFSLFSYFEITWARQARSYMLQQLFLLFALWIYIGLVRKFSASRFFLLILILILGVLTHTTFLLFIFSLLLHFIYLCFHWNFFNLTSLKKFLPYFVVLGFFSIILFINNYIQGIVGGLQLAIENHPNNVWYYHSFLWREHTIITLLAMIGLLLNFIKYRKGTFLVIVPILCYLLFICFIFPPYVSRYILPIFPLFLILAGYAIATLAQAVQSRFSLLIILCISILIIINGDKFVIKPKAFYSVNHDMREIALVDYHQIYSIIKTKMDDKTVIIDTWPDRARWYVGYENKNIYYFHWQNTSGNVNGLTKQTVFINEDEQKVLPGFKNPQIRFLGTLADLEQTMKAYPKGFIWIDDNSLSREIIEYAKNNLNQEIYLDHYPLDDNPYSIWPGTLYSWGFEN